MNALLTRESPRVKYRHVLALNPYHKSSTTILGLFPPTGLEYIATSMKDLVGEEA
jgi:hypothetical protein